ncbi:MAG: VWA domain-containing protein [Vicinamibacterales bacterium]|nr:VWA domain-containing protein [Vicinamibacterales bacterium]
MPGPSSLRSVLSAGLVVLVAGLAAQQPAVPERAPLPPFRGGANLVRVDAYISQNGQAVTDLTADDFEVLEDNAPQSIEQFELIEPRPIGPESDRLEPNSVREAEAMAADPRARLFVLFMDVWHVQLSGSYRAQEPVGRLLERLIGQDDMVGVMTPEMSAHNITFARRTSTLQAMMATNWYWGQRDRVDMVDPREEAYLRCYGANEAIVNEMVDRRREKKTLDALEEMVVHLEGVREERKFVLLLSEGWRLFQRNEALGAALGTEQVVDPLHVGPTGRLTLGSDPRQLTDAGMTECERDRQLLANLDNQLTFQLLVQRANRSNVSFYTIDPRGLVAFDEPIGPRMPATPVEDGRRLFNRQSALRTLAEETDGVAVLNTNDVTGAVSRFMGDLGSYYLLGYYSTNTRLDGRYRRLTVRVKRPGLEVRARPGYLAPRESELAAVTAVAAAPAGPPPAVAAALGRLGSARGTLPLRIEASGFWPPPDGDVGGALPAAYLDDRGAGAIWVVIELDAATVRDEAWRAGGEVEITFQPPPNLIAEPVTVTRSLAPGQRTLSLVLPEGPGLEPGRYIVRAQVTATGARLPLQLSVGTDVPAPGALIGTTPMASRRGPSTGLQYQATADPRFRRTERLRVEVPVSLRDATISAQLLTRDGQPMPLPVTIGERMDADRGLPFLVADVTLAPLAQGEYVLEVSAERQGTTERVAYGFRLVP